MQQWGFGPWTSSTYIGCFADMDQLHPHIVTYNSGQHVRYCLGQQLHLLCQSLEQAEHTQWQMISLISRSMLSSQNRSCILGAKHSAAFPHVATETCVSSLLSLQIEPCVMTACAMATIRLWHIIWLWYMTHDWSMWPRQLLFAAQSIAVTNKKRKVEAFQWL